MDSDKKGSKWLYILVIVALAVGIAVGILIANYFGKETKLEPSNPSGELESSIVNGPENNCTNSVIAQDNGISDIVALFDNNYLGKYFAYYYQFDKLLASDIDSKAIIKASAELLYDDNSAPQLTPNGFEYSDDIKYTTSEIDELARKYFSNNVKINHQTVEITEIGASTLTYNGKDTYTQKRAGRGDASTVIINRSPVSAFMCNVDGKSRYTITYKVMFTYESPDDYIVYNEPVFFYNAPSKNKNNIIYENKDGLKYFSEFTNEKVHSYKFTFDIKDGVAYFYSVEKVD